MTWKAAALVEPLNMPTALKFVLLKYANHADNDGFDTWPSYERVAHFTGQSVKTVQRAVERLRAEEIMVEQGAPYGGRGKRGRGIAYRIDFARAQALYGYWTETRTSKSFTFKLTPRTEDPALEAARDRARKTPDRESSVSGPETPDSQAQTQDSQDLNSGHVSGATPHSTALSSGESSKNPIEAAREDGRPGGPSSPTGTRNQPGSASGSSADGSAPVPTETAQSRSTPANAHWKARQGDLERFFGKPVFKSWVSVLIPEADDGKTLVLAAPSRFVQDWVRSNYVDGIATVVERRVKVIARTWCGKADAARRTAATRERAGVGGV